MDLFDKCYSFTRADEVKQAGLYPYFHPIEENEGPVVTVEGKKMIMAGSNNYLGLTAHPKVKEAAIDAIKKYGTGCSGSRYLTGTLDLHNQLEKRFAKFLGTEDVLLFSTGYQTAMGIISTITQKGEYIICDRENHASIMNAAMTAKGAFVELLRYKHNDMKSLEKVLSDLPLDVPKFIVTDGVFSVTGEVVNLPQILNLGAKYNARVLCDDAHATGVVGVGGRGTFSFHGLEVGKQLVMGTFSKTFSSLGGFVGGPERVINYLKHHSPALIFSASPTPPSCAAALASLDLLEEHPELVAKLLSNAEKMRKGFKELGFKIIESPSAIVPVLVGDVEKAFIFWRKLFDAGIFVNAFIPPGVPPNMSMMRTSYMASHEDEHLEKILDVFKIIGKDLGII